MCCADGGAAILDYKTGSLPKKDWIAAFLAPQLPLEGAILEAGGFDGIGAMTAAELIYLRLSGGAKPRRRSRNPDAAALAAEAAAKLGRASPGSTTRPRPIVARRAASRRHRGRLRSSGAGARMVAFGMERRVMSDPSTTASDPHISAWVAANAGAGKTYTLANRVTRLLLADARPQRILCLTFTKAAAAEMQGRLFDQLGRWSMLPDDRLRAAISEIGAVADNLPKARRLFAQALETPGGLKVLTIHAFCQIVLSRFPIEAGVAPGFTVLDDNSARGLIAEARPAVLERARARRCAAGQRRGPSGDRKQRGHADRAFWARHWAMTGASWTVSSTEPGRRLRRIELSGARMARCAARMWQAISAPR